MDETVGIWLIGARGSLATTATLGAYALAAGLTRPVGCVSEHPEIDGRGLVDYRNVVIGGHDITDLSLEKRTEQLITGDVVSTALVHQLRNELAASEHDFRPGVKEPTDQAATVQRLRRDIEEFSERHGLDRTVVIDLSSTEAPHDPGADAASWQALQTAWEHGRTPLSASSLYACAALLAGCAYVGFTPSTGIAVPALEELAARQRLPYAGRDGKTGETLVKSALAPMFAARALRVRSWTSVNLLGGGDGQTLSDPETATSKTATKQSGVDSILNSHIDGPMHIDYVEDLGDWKTAWDHIRFDGFLGARMTMQFTWQGCDSALAAPLVLDLARFVARAHAVGEYGPLRPLGFFFKDPLASDEHRLAQQWQELRTWASDCGRRFANR